MFHYVRHEVTYRMQLENYTIKIFVRSVVQQSTELK